MTKPLPHNPGPGGARPGSGRPAMAPGDRRRTIAASIPGWLADWLDSQPGPRGATIEAALVKLLEAPHE